MFQEVKVQFQQMKVLFQWCLQKRTVSGQDNQILTDRETDQVLSTDIQLATENTEASQRETITTIETSLNDLDMTPESIHNCQYADPDL